MEERENCRAFRYIMVKPTHGIDKERTVRAFRYIMMEPTPGIKRELSRHSGT